jgi:hypothetical protein
MDFRFDIELLDEVDEFLGSLDEKTREKFCIIYGNQE